jgi:hypothetical protein
MTEESSYQVNDLQQQPIIEFKSSIEYVGTQKLHQTELSEDRFKMIDSQAAGDGVFNKTIKVDEEPSSHLFIYTLNLKSINFNAFKPSKGIWQISLMCENSNIQRTFVNCEILEDDIIDNCMIKFNEINLKLYFVAEMNKISEMINSIDVCTLCVKGPHNFINQANLNCKSFMSNGNIEDEFNGNVVLSNQNQLITGIASITISLTDAGKNSNENFAKINVIDDNFNQNIINNNDNNNKRESLFDENVAYHMLEELEQWKEKERDKFFEELKLSEIEYLQKLKKDFDLLKITYESEYIKKVSALKHLTKSLENIQKSQTENYERTMKQKENNLKIKLEESYKNELIKIRECARNMECEHLHDLKLLNQRYEDLECCNFQLTEENVKLRSINENMKIENEKLKNSLMEKAQIEKDLMFLKDQLKSTQESKEFYKQELLKTIRESGKMKVNKASSVIFELPKRHSHSHHHHRHQHEHEEQEDCIFMDRSELDEIKKNF